MVSKREIEQKLAEKQEELKRLDERLTPLLGQRMRIIKEIKELQQLLKEDGS